MITYSHTRLAAYEQCPRKYWYAYIEKPQIERIEGIETVLGKCAHASLEALYRGLFDGKAMDLAKLIDFYDDRWDTALRTPTRINRSDLSADDYKVVGQNALRDYYSKHQPFNQSRTIGLEKRVQVQLGGTDEYRVAGVIDRLSRRADGTYEIHDYKTSSHLPPQSDADADRQLALYEIGLRAQWDDVREVDLVWHYLRFGAEIRSKRTPDQLEAVKDHCVQLIREIEVRGTDEAGFPAKESVLCGWCDYACICPVRKHVEAVASLPEEKRPEDTGVTLVDKWAQLRDRRLALDRESHEIKDEEKKIQEKLTGYAADQGISTIEGSMHSVQISRQTTIEFPATGDERREAFEEALRKEGVWEKAAAINAHTLKSVWEDEAVIGPEAKARLREFIVEGTTEKMSIKAHKHQGED